MKEKCKGKMFYFCDDVINNSYEYLEGLCDLFIKNRLDISWVVFAKIGNLDKYILTKMKKAGCSCLFIGVESGSDRMLKIMNKGFNSEQAAITLKLISEVGLMGHILFIAGYPSETQEDINQTLGFIRENRKYIHSASVHKFVLYCRTHIHCNPKKYGIENLSLLSSPFRFIFDESNGLKWEQKQKQQIYSEIQIQKAIYSNIKFYRKTRVFIHRSSRLFISYILKIKRFRMLI
jgi:radical SAM superfamily enzyme YgiQ (UPF0313 family)